MVGQPGVPTSRASFSEEMVLIDDMMRPPGERDAMLRHVASWGDRLPHAGFLAERLPSCQPCAAGWMLDGAFVMYGRPPLGKGAEQGAGVGQERSCIRPLIAVG
jgi:hypothetical protein